MSAIKEPAMPPAETLKITLPSELARLVRAKVEAGAYASDSEVISEALTVWRERAAEDERRIVMIRSKIKESLDDPRPSVTDEDLAKRLDALHAATLKARSGAA